MSDGMHRETPEQIKAAIGKPTPTGEQGCKCVRGIGLYGAELGIVKDCPIHGDKSNYNPPEYTYDSDNAD